MVNTKLSVVGVIYKVSDVKAVLNEEGKKFGITIEVNFN
jgi:hypothetical protein